jgi:ABC-type amino acid transport substrate-binding protein
MYQFQTIIRVIQGSALHGSAIAVLLLFASAACAQNENAEDSARPELVVATKEAPPFVIKGGDGAWTGISITLWDRVASELGYTYRFEEASLADMVDGVADGRFDLSVAATTITPAREQQVDFSHPFYTTGFGIAVNKSGYGWWKMAAGLLSADFFKAVGLLALLLTVIGFFFWLAESRRNPEEFRPDALRGIGDGFWFSAVTMTTVGYGDMAPRTFAGRLVALVWMFTAILIISTFTGMIASSLTADRLQGRIRGPADLPNVRVGAIGGSASDDWLSHNGIAFQHLADPQAGLTAIRDGQIDAFVHDKPLLQYLVNIDTTGDFDIVAGSFGRQDYGIARTQGSELREMGNRALLNYLDSADWEGLKARYIGRPE